MAGVTFKMEVDTSGLDRLAESVHQKLSQVVRKAAFDIQGHARQNAPVDTGAMRNSIGVIATGSPDYNRAVASAQAANPDVKTFDEPAVTNDLTAIVAVGVEYGIYIEMGHVVGMSRENGSVSMAARPFLGPAVDQVTPAFEQAVKYVLDNPGRFING